MITPRTLAALVLVAVAVVAWRNNFDTARAVTPAPTVSPSAQVPLDQYGGHPGLQVTPSGYFAKVRLPSGRWWLIDPDGNAFYAAGVTYVNPWGFVSTVGTNPYADTMRAKYGNPIDMAAWSADTISRLRAWGYNTAGPWSDPSLFSTMPHTVDLMPMLQARSDVNPSGDRQLDAYPLLWEESPWDVDYRRYFFDVFHPQFEATLGITITAQIAAGHYVTDTTLLGYLVDNELPLWQGRNRDASSPWFTANTLADVFIALPASAYGKQAWINLLKTRYQNDIASLNATWGTSYASFDVLANVTRLPSDNPLIQVDKSLFLRKIYDQYFGTIASALRAADPNHLYLGPRLVVRNVINPQELYDAAAAYVDVLTINYYVFRAMTYDALKAEMDAEFARIYRGKPILITEYSFGARDSGMPATHINGAVVDTQEQRAQLALDYRRIIAETPYVVGDFWWDYVDPPLPANSIGNEDSNLGLVDSQDRLYLRFLYPMSRENRLTYARRGLSEPASALISSLAYSPVSTGSLTGTSVLSAASLFSTGAYTTYVPVVMRSYDPTVPTPTPTPTATPTPVAQVVTMPGGQGNLTLPTDALATSPITATVQVVPTPTSVPASLNVLRAVQVSVTKVSDGSSVSELDRDATFELSYDGLGLTDDQISRLVIYNASRGEYLPTTLDRTRKVAIATTRRFSVFTLAQVSGTNGWSLSFTLAAPVSSARLDIFDGSAAQAGITRTITSGPLPVGQNTLTWDGTDNAGRPAPGGKYFYVLTVATTEGHKDYAFGVGTK